MIGMLPQWIKTGAAKHTTVETNRIVGQLDTILGGGDCMQWNISGVSIFEDVPKLDIQITKVKWVENWV